MSAGPTRRSREEPSTSATVLGASATVVGLALAALTSLAIDRVAHGRLSVGFALVAGVVAGRWLLGEVLALWFGHAAHRVRRRGRASVLAFFLVPSSTSNSSPVQIAAAIDDLSEAPRLAVVRASAQTSIIALLLVFWAGGWQALGIVLVLLAVAVPLYQRAGQRAAALDVQYRERRTRLGERQLELLAHAPEVRALGATSYAAQEIAALSTSEHQVALRAIRSALGSSLVTEFLSGVSVGLVAMSVGFGLLDGRISLIRALLAVLVTSEFFGHVRRFGVEFHRRDAIASAQELLVAPDLVAISPSDVLEAFDLVTHVHPSAVSLRLERGDRVGVLGASGIGKTTLAHTLLGWREPQHGHVQRTSDPVAYVSSETTLVSGTLRENLSLARDVPDVRLRQELRAVGLDDQRFDDLDQPVSPDGEGFSSGERVRLLLVRALVHEPALLVLDDVAGLLDAAARDKIRSELTRRGDMAIIEISVDETIFISASTNVHLS